MDRFKTLLSNVTADPISTLVGLCTFVLLVAKGTGHADVDVVTSNDMIAMGANYACAALAVFSNIFGKEK